MVPHSIPVSTEKSTERVSVSTYIEQDLYNRLGLEASSHERSLSAEIRLALKEHVERLDDNIRVRRDRY